MFTYDKRIRRMLRSSCKLEDAVQTTQITLNASTTAATATATAHATTTFTRHCERSCHLLQTIQSSALLLVLPYLLPLLLVI
jgi:hypothetical protein